MNDEPKKPDLEEPKERVLSSTQPGYKGGPETQPDVAPVTTPSGLSVGDLQNISMIIDLCTRRGSFKAEELATVGGVYNKLKAFLDSLPKPEGEPDKTKDAPATEMPANAPKPEGENK
jgi:hypothetical protein|tara:strand:- start:589 stop:942 length:354 start_codon:yes stop_codon:yes gene_type:complete